MMVSLLKFCKTKVIHPGNLLLSFEPKLFERGSTNIKRIE